MKPKITILSEKDVTNDTSTRKLFNVDTKKRGRNSSIRYIVREAKRQKKTFTIHGRFPDIRQALLNRGWIECYHGSTQVTRELSLMTKPEKNDNTCCEYSLSIPNLNLHLRDSERALASQLLSGYDVDFYWSSYHKTSDCPNKNKIINRFPHQKFTTKDGLCFILRNYRWCSDSKITKVNFPRCYAMNHEEQANKFIKDYQLTACVSLLRWFNENYTEGNIRNICSAKGNISIATLHFAVDRCNEYVAIKKQRDVDKKVTFIWEDNWTPFFKDFNLLVNGKDTFNLSSNTDEITVQKTVSIALTNVEKYLPQAHLDGVHNLWILKPGNKCRGRDIQIVTKIEQSLTHTHTDLKYIIQKYIERPLLVYNTKFDIRQWFLVTSLNPLCVWMYRDCYLRFSSKPFSLSDLHESVHLTNHAVQYKYRTVKYDKKLPDDKMWDSSTFKTYLHSIGKGEMWYTTIYPGMLKGVVGALLASQDGTESRPNTFELFGADFMIASDFTPWLLEINACPDMSRTTTVTNKLCPACFEDIIKVVIDRRDDPNADTGNFQLVYKQDDIEKIHSGQCKTVAKEKTTKKNIRSVPIPVCSKYNPSVTVSATSVKSTSGFYKKQINADLYNNMYPDMIEPKDKRFLLKKECRLDYYKIKKELFPELDYDVLERFSFEKQLRFGRNFKDYGSFTCEVEKDMRFNSEKRFERLGNIGIKPQNKTTQSVSQKLADYERDCWVERMIKIDKKSHSTNDNRYEKYNTSRTHLVDKDTHNSKSSGGAKQTRSSKYSLDSPRIGTDKQVFVTSSGLTTIIPTKERYAARDVTCMGRKNQSRRSSSQNKTTSVKNKEWVMKHLIAPVYQARYNRDVHRMFLLVATQNELVMCINNHLKS